MKRSGIALALLTLLLPIAAEAQQEPVIARLTTYDGTLDVIRSGIPLALYVDLPLFSGDTVSTRDGRASIRFDDRSEIRLRKNTKLSVTDRKERRDVEVFFGRLWAFVAGHKEKTTSFRTGNTIAAVRGTVLEYATDPPRVGVGKDGPVDLSTQLPDGTRMSITVTEGFMASVTPTGVSDLTKFAEGQIADGNGTEGTPPPSSETPPTEPPPPPPPPAPPTEPPGEGTSAASAEAAPAATDDAAPSVPTQGEYAMKLVNALGIQSALPPNATVRDAMQFLANLGILPSKGECDCTAGPPCECSGVWRADAPVKIEDLLCIVNLNPCDPDAPFLSTDEVIQQLLSQYGELFWIQTRRKLTVSPFAP